MYNQKFELQDKTLNENRKQNSVMQQIQDYKFYRFISLRHNIQKWIKRNINLLVFFLLVIPLFSGCSNENAKDANNLNTNGVQVKVSTPIQKKMTQYLNFNASSTFIKKEIVRASFQGYVVKTYKTIGDKIKKGDLLFSIKTKEAAAIDSLKIDLSSRVFSGIVNVYSHSNGVLSQLYHQTGDYVSDSDQLALIIAPNSLRIMLRVPFQYANTLKRKKQFTLRLPDGSEHIARITKIIPTVDAVDQTETFILKSISKILIPENLNLNVDVSYKVKNNAIVLPKSAVLTNETQDEFWVMKIVGTKAIRVDVKKGIENDSSIQIVQPPLNLSDKFVTDGAFGLPDTVNVSIIK